METLIRRYFWPLAGVILLFAVLVGAATALLDIEVEQAQLQSSLRVKLPGSQLAHEARWSLTPREAPASGPGIREVAEHTYELSSADMDAAFARPGALTRPRRPCPTTGASGRPTCSATTHRGTCGSARPASCWGAR